MRALRAPFKAGAGRQAPQCARTALNLRWIPAFAGMAECAMPMGSFSRGSGFSGFLHGLESRNPA